MSRTQEFQNYIDCIIEDLNKTLDKKISDWDNEDIEKIDRHRSDLYTLLKSSERAHYAKTLNEIESMRRMLQHITGEMETLKDISTSLDGVKEDLSLTENVIVTKEHVVSRLLVSNKVNRNMRELKKKDGFNRGNMGRDVKVFGVGVDPTKQEPMAVNVIGHFKDMKNYNFYAKSVIGSNHCLDVINFYGIDDLFLVPQYVHFNTEEAAAIILGSSKWKKISALLSYGRVYRGNISQFRQRNEDCALLYNF